MDDIEINKRLDVVQYFVESPYSRSRLLDGPLKSIPDIELLLTR